MAAVLEAFAPFVKKMITDMAEEEVRMLLGVPGEMEKLGQNLDNIKAFVADAERRRITEDLVQGWVRMLKGVMYDATDVLELRQLKAEERRESICGTLEEKMPGCLQPFVFFLRNPAFSHKIGKKIKELNQRLEFIHQEAAKFNFIANLCSYQEQRIEAECSSQRMTPEFIPSKVVGEKIERDTNLLVKELIITSKIQGMKVVSIVGMGGIGKTTLAQKIYKDAAIDEHFKTKIWLSITQQFNEVELLRTAIKHAGQDPGVEQDNTLLTQILTNALSARKFLLVLDDMWGVRAWESVLSVPVTNASDKQPGSRVLITTRFGDLAPRMHDFFYEHHVRPLNKGDAWSLLKNQFPQRHNQVAGVDHLKDIGMKIIKKCGGLPLAVKIMGGLLRTKPQTEREWEAILSHHAWSLDGLPRELDHRLYLSYEHLSPHLKQCFLYCSLFPKGTPIAEGIVSAMWISEGFIQPQDGRRSSEEVAAEYYQELIMRNLIEPSKLVTKYECMMHDVVRSFAEFMVREESLVLHNEPVSSSVSIGLLRRLSVGSKNLVLEWALLQKPESLRTLIIECRINIKPGDSLSSFCSLRVLHIKDADCDGLVDSLCQLRHLRYLGFWKTNVSKLPDDIHRLKFLQYIMLRYCRSLEKLPNSIIKLANLRKISIEGSPHVLIPKGFGALTNLTALFGFQVHVETNGGWCSLDEIAHLSQLRDLTLYSLDNVSTSSWVEKATISSKGHLSYMKLSWRSTQYMELRDEHDRQQQQKTAEEVLDKLRPPSCMEHLLIEGYFGCRLANWMMVPSTTAFNSLRYLMMRDLPCCSRLPDGLCRLLGLEALTVIDAPAIKSVGPEFQAASPSLAVDGDITATSAAFPNLTNLHLEGLCEWEEWEWEEQGEDMMAMPALKILKIKNCKLSRLPRGLASSKRHALRILDLSHLTNLTYVVNFPSIVELYVLDCPGLKRISGFSRLHQIRIIRCPNLEVLEGVPTLDSMELWDATMETLPGYLQVVKPRYLKLTCSKKLYESLSPGSSGRKNISHLSYV